MGAIVIKSENAKNLKLIMAIAEQLGDSVSKLSPTQFEDIQLGMLMKKEKTGKKIAKEDVFKYLDA